MPLYAGLGYPEFQLPLVASPLSRSHQPCLAVHRSRRREAGPRPADHLNSSMIVWTFRGTLIALPFVLLIASVLTVPARPRESDVPVLAIGRIDPVSEYP